VIIQVPRCFEHLLTLAENRSDKLFCSCLAVCAGDPDNRHRQPGAKMAREGLKRPKGIINKYYCFVSGKLSRRYMDKSAIPAFQGRSDIIMPVKMLTLQGDKELSFPDSSRINRKAGKFLGVSAEHFAPGCQHYVFKS
jgi:hypothetical protein